MTATRDSQELHCPPRYGTPRSPDRPTIGPQVAHTSALLGKPYLPWQRHIADVAYEIDMNTGRLAYSTVVVIAGRQEGKTELILPVMTHRCMSFDDAHVSKLVRERLHKDAPDPGPQTVMYVAQDTETSRKKWRDLHLPRLQASPAIRPLFNPRLQRTMEAIRWRNGSMWVPGSTTPKGSGTGDTLDLGVIDEAWSHRDNRVEAGLRPAQKSRPWRQLWIMSMIPGPTKLSAQKHPDWSYLRNWRQIGRARVAAGVTEGVAFFDFTAPEGMDPGDPATWWTCLPSLGHLNDETPVREAFDAFDLADFEAEYLGWEPKEAQPRWTLVSRQDWQENALDRQSEIASRPALAIEIDEDRSTAWVAASGYRDDGRWHVEVVEPGGQVPTGAAGTAWVLPRVLEMCEKNKVLTVVIDPRRPAASLIQPLRSKGINVLTPNQLEIAGACGRFVDAVSGDQVRHIGQTELDRALATARRFDVGNGGFTLVRKSSGLSVSTLYAVVLAMLGAEVKGPEAMPPPEIYFIDASELDELDEFED